MLFFWLILSLILSALFSGAEIAFVSANKLRVELKKKKGSARGAILAHFYDRPAEFLGTMLVGNNVVLVLFTTLMTKLLLPVLTPSIAGEFWPGLIITIVTTLIVLVFGEFLPKTLFRLFADEILYFLAYPIKFFQILLAVPAWLMTRISNGLLSLFFRTPESPVDNVFTRLDLETFIRNTKSGPNRDTTIEREIFEKALYLKEVKVKECMVPRTEIENIDVNSSIHDLEERFIETKLSRLLVTKDDIDNILGYVHHQQLLKEPKTIRSMILDIPFVPETMRVRDLMNKFIKERLSIACVVDEFGGVAGVITLEDILEEIFGEIEDEHDQEDYVEVAVSEREYIFSGRLEIAYLNEKYPHLNFPEGEYHTLSGYLVMTTTSIPEQGAEIILDGYKYVLEMVSETKIETVRVIVLDEGEG